MLGDLGRGELLWWLPRVYRGTHLTSPKVMVRRARAVVVEAAAPMPVQVDGEAWATTPATFVIAPAAPTVRR